MSEDLLTPDYNTLGYMGTLKGFPPPGDANEDTQWVTGKIGTGALHLNLDDPCDTNPFDQGDDYVEIPPLNLNSNTVTFTTWANSSGIQRDDGGLFFCSYQDDGDGVDATQSGFVLGLGGDNWLNYNWANSNKTYAWDPMPDFNLPNHSWTFCALTIAPGTARIYIKKDGEAMKFDTNLDATHAPETFAIPSRIGDHKGRRFSGAMDDFRIYDRTLDPCEVQFLAYQGAIGTDPTTTNLYAHYLFDDGSGLTAVDDAGSALNYWPVPSQANICGDAVEAQYDRFVNMRDFGCLADDWLVEMLCYFGTGPGCFWFGSSGIWRPGRTFPVVRVNRPYGEKTAVGGGGTAKLFARDDLQQLVNAGAKHFGLKIYGILAIFP
jgi:hypothetical protein